jgi:putative phosphoesterase
MNNHDGPLRIGVISDTHGVLRPQAASALRGVHAIVHAGDIGGEHVLEGLEDIAPVAAIRGNNDRDAWALRIPDCRVVAHAAARIYLIHDKHDLKDHPAPAGCNVVVTGHTHMPLVERRDGVLYLNPGSAGPRRFKLPISVAMLRIGASIEAEIIELAI